MEDGKGEKIPKKSPINGQPVPSNPSGRPKGIPNKSTTQAREAIAMFVEGNVERLSGWLDEIASDNPKDAFNCFMDVVEYHIPKLARTEHSGIDGKPIEHKISDENDMEILKRFINKASGAKDDNT